MIKNRRMSALFILSGILMSPQINAEMEAKLAGALICADQDIVTVMACNLGQTSAINLYAVGNNLVSIDESSLELTQLKVGSKNILKDEIDRPNYELGSFSDIKKEGKVVDFDIMIKSGLESLYGEVSMKGHLTAYTGSGVQVKKSKLFDPNEHSEMQIGPIKLKAKKAKGEGSEDFIKAIKEQGTLSDSNLKLFEEMVASGVVTQDKSLPELEEDINKSYPDIDMETEQELASAIMQYALSNAFDMSDDEDLFAFEIEVDENAVEKIELENSKGEIIDKQGAFTSNGVKEYLFERTKDAKVRLVVSYQKDLKPVKINIDI